MKKELSEKQSEDLIELGLSPELASNSYRYDCGFIKIAPGEEYECWSETDIFSIDDLIDIFPKEINGNLFEMGVSKVEDSYLWFCGYQNVKIERCVELSDAIYYLTKWLLTNKHI